MNKNDTHEIQIKDMPDYWYTADGSPEELRKLLNFLSEKLSFELTEDDRNWLLENSDTMKTMKMKWYSLAVHFVDQKPYELIINPNYLSDEEAASGILSPQAKELGEKLKSVIEQYRNH